MSQILRSRSQEWKVIVAIGEALFNPDGHRRVGNTCSSNYLALGMYCAYAFKDILS